MKSTLHFVLFCFTLSLISGCDTTSKFIGKKIEEKVTIGQLDNGKFNEIKRILAERSSGSLNDTIIIKYDYNNNQCWSLLDQENDDYIQGVISGHNRIIQANSAVRPNISVFNFREPGKTFSKKVLWDKNIIVDSSKLLFNLLFKTRNMCGNSIIVLPDKRFVFIPSDPHFEALHFTNEQISSFLKDK